MNTCPDCTGEHWAVHPCGYLTFQHRVDCPTLRAEDATKHADYIRASTAYGTWERPATSTERRLLAHLGHDVPPDLTTRVTPRYPSVVLRRTWPALSL